MELILLLEIDFEEAKKNMIRSALHHQMSVPHYRSAFLRLTELWDGRDKTYRVNVCD